MQNIITKPQSNASSAHASRIPSEFSEFSEHSELSEQPLKDPKASQPAEASQPSAHASRIPSEFSEHSEHSEQPLKDLKDLKALNPAENQAPSLSLTADDVARLVSEAEQRGYLRGRNEILSSQMHQDPLWENPRREQMDNRQKLVDQFLANAGKGVW